MVLSKPDIERYIEDHKLVIEPAPAHSRINQVSVDLRLGRKFTVMKKLPPHVPKVRVKPSLLEPGDSWDPKEGDSFDLHPGAFVLAQTLETVTMPPRPRWIRRRTQQLGQGGNRDPHDGPED